MNIAITGGRGFLGAAVAEHVLASGHEIVVIDQVPVPADGVAGRRDLVVDTGDFDALAAALAGCDALLHLAAHPNPDREQPWVVHNDNVVSSYNALLAAAEAGITHVAMASSINYYGMHYAKSVHLDYLPVDEEHPSYNDDPYSLSKVVMEEQARSIARRYPQMSIAALRFHWVVANRPAVSSREPQGSANQLWGYVTIDGAVRACLAAVTTDFLGFEPFLIVAQDTLLDLSSAGLAGRFYPEVPLRRGLRGNVGFFDCSKAQQVLGWSHNPDFALADV